MSLEFSQKIQKIKEKINIVDIIGQYLKLNRKGNNFWAICPFHQDSNPSLSVSQEKQIYKCFSCGERGNVFMFVQKYKNLDFFSALKEIVAFTKINLKEFDLQVNNLKTIELHRFKTLNNLAVNFYQYQLTTKAGQAASIYLKQRNITSNNIKNFALGFAPSSNQLLSYLQLQGYEEIDIIESGLAKITVQDKVKDMFFNRIIFPIIDLEGNCLGFSARNYLEQEKDNFKYFNTPETEIFKKGQILYNLYNAKKALTSKNKSIYLVEGYMDVISLSNQNINNCVALMGTSLTKEQIAILTKITKNIIIFLDGDEAGKLAAIKISTNLLAYDFEVKIIDNSTSLDPDELINQNLAVFKKIINSVLHPLDFAINFFLKKYPIKNDSFQLKAFLEELKPLLKTLKDSITINFYLHSLAKITNLSQEQLLTIFQLHQNLLPEAKAIVLKQKKIPVISLQTKLLEIEKQLFFLLLLDRSVYLFLEKEKFIFHNKKLMNLYFLIVQEYQENEKLKSINQQAILLLLKDNEILQLLEEIINNYQSKNYSFSKEVLQDYLKMIKKYLIEIEIENLTHKIATSSDFETQIALLQKMSILKNKFNE